ncbi:lipase 1-like isoform X2 [Thrips palmi]|uniref:Lipase 1-like isoform X2 n=1 Tax=Thrips palmi TaxID=161013 RepID=A0A6P8Z1B2_THRPL|nr:lipase 1-like isoform X2 [Thrips palmi]
MVRHCRRLEKHAESVRHAIALRSPLRSRRSHKSETGRHGGTPQASGRRVRAGGRQCVPAQAQDPQGHQGGVVGELVFLIAEQGYDVWTVNYRGSFYSRRHRTLNTKDHEFWDFSWHENGVIDQAEAIDYVLNATGYKQLIVVGHSMSSTAQVVLLAERPEYNDKVMGQVLMCPTVLFGHPTGAVAWGLGRLNDVSFQKLDYHDSLENDWVPGLAHPVPETCYINSGSPKAILMPHCLRIFDFIMGKIHRPVNDYLLYLILHHYPAGASIKQMVHYIQSSYSGNFSLFDYGKDRNQELYGQDIPPLYNLTNIRTPTYFVYGSADATVNWKDVKILADRMNLGVVKKLHLVVDYNHIDYLIATDADKVIYPALLKYLDEIRDGSYSKELERPKVTTF